MLHDMTPGDGILDQILALILPPPSKPAPPPAPVRFKAKILAEAHEAFDAFWTDLHLQAVVICEDKRHGVLVICRNQKVADSAAKLFDAVTYPKDVSAFWWGGVVLRISGMTDPEKVLAKLR